MFLCASAASRLVEVYTYHALMLWELLGVYSTDTWVDDSVQVPLYIGLAHHVLVNITAFGPISKLESCKHSISCAMFRVSPEHIHPLLIFRGIGCLLLGGSSGRVSVAGSEVTGVISDLFSCA